MKKPILMISCGLLLCLACLYSTQAFGIEPALLLKSKMLAVEKTDGLPIVGLELSIADIRNDGKNEIAISGNGYMRILEWTGTAIESKWKSSQYSYQLGPITMEQISPLVLTSYYLDNKLTTDFLVFIPTAAKAVDTYRLSWRNHKIDFQRVGTAPFNWFDLSGKCSDGTTVILGKKFHPNGNYAALYKWNGSGLVEKWHGASGTGVKAAGEMLSDTRKKASIFLAQGKQQIGTISCDNDSFRWKVVDKDGGAIDLRLNDILRSGTSLFGVTKKNSINELWSIQYSNNEPEYNAKLYVSQFNGNKFSSFSRVSFKGINSDMIFNMIITDIDNDGVGEIVGVEEEIRKTIPRKPQPGDTGEESDVLLITSNLFLAKWNGKEYEVKWHRKAIDEKVRTIAVGDVIGDGKKEILITDDNGYLYVFEMPTDK